MFRLFSLLFIAIVSLHALSSSEILKRADGFMKSDNKSNKFRAYNDYKNLYLRAIMAEDDKLKVNALKGIVNSGNQLHIDISQYSKELSTFKPKTSYQAPKSKSIQKSKKSTDIKVKSSHKLKSIRWKDDSLVLKFDKKLNTKQINYFTLYDSKNKSYKYVFDVHASMLTKSQNLRKKGIKRIRLAQFNTNTLRLVIENSKKLKIRYTKQLSQLIISVDSLTTSTTSKSVVKKHLHQELTEIKQL